MRKRTEEKLQIMDAYTDDEAKSEIDWMLLKYPESCTFKYYEKEANITDGYLVASRYDRLRICSILSRCGVTARRPENLAAEWLIHNLAYKLNFKRGSAVDVALDYGKDARWQVNAVTRLLELLRIY